MGIPKTRKKLNQGTAGESGSESISKKIMIDTDEAPAAKLDQAFEIVEHMENKTDDTETSSENTEPMRESMDKKARPGFRWRISLEAVVPEDAPAKPRNKEKSFETAPILNFDVTVPFLWRAPVIGTATKKCIAFLKNFRK